jgi:hypothetical protein
MASNWHRNKEVALSVAMIEPPKRFRSMARLVLVVDDEPLVGDYTASLLDKLGCVVIGRTTRPRL